MGCSQLSMSRTRATFLSLAVLLAAVLGSSPARAYCRAVTATPPAGYDPSTMGCFGIGDDGGADAGLHPLFWRNQCVNFNLNRAASATIPPA